MTLSLLAQRLLPSALYEPFAASSIAKRLARGFLWSLFGSATSRILVLVAMIGAAHILGRASFGELGLIQSTLGVFGIMAGVGLGSTATRFVAKYAKPDPARAGRVIALVTASSALTVFVAAASLVALSALIAERILHAPHLQEALIAGTFLLAATAFRGIQNGVFAGLERFDTIAKLNILDGVLSLPAIILLASLSGLEGALIGLALSATLVWIAGRLVLARALQERRIRIRYWGAWADWPILAGYSLPSFLANSVATPVLWLAMTLVAQTDDGFSDLGLYNAAYQWHGPMAFLPMILMSVSIPVLVQEWEAGQIRRFRRVFFSVASVAGATTLSGAMLVSVLSPWILSLYGPGFREGWAVLVLLAMAAPLHAISKISSGALFGMNRAWWVFVANLTWSATLLGGTLMLLGTWGISGLAIAFLSAYAVLAVVTTAFVLVCSGAAVSNDAAPLRLGRISQEL